MSWFFGYWVGLFLHAWRGYWVVSQVGGMDACYVGLKLLCKQSKQKGADYSGTTS